MKLAPSVATQKPSVAYRSFQESTPECGRKGRWNVSLVRNVVIRGPAAERNWFAKSIFDLEVRLSFVQKYVENPEG